MSMLCIAQLGPVPVLLGAAAYVFWDEGSTVWAIALFAFGLVGIFVGPVVLAVGYTLLDAWMHEREDEPAPPDFRD